MEIEKIKFLVIDDIKTIGSLFEITLSQAGHEIKTTQSGDEGIDYVKNEKFDMVFCDICMPYKDGVSVLEEIKEIQPSLPVVMMSGYYLEIQRQRIQEIGANGFLDKPFEIGDVRKAVKIAVGKDI